MKDFAPDQLERALALFEHVDARRWTLDGMPEGELRLHCEFWVFQARALLEEDLGEGDLKACHWVLRVVTAIANQNGIFIFGLSRHHRDNWALRAHRLAARLRRRPMDEEPLPPTQKRRVVLVETSKSPARVPEFLPELQGRTILVVGGEHDAAVVERYQEAGFVLDWIPGNVRQVQGVVVRIGRGRVGGVIFLSDLNRHTSFFTVREACRKSGTPIVLGTRGAGGIERALGSLNKLVSSGIAERQVRHG